MTDKGRLFTECTKIWTVVEFPSSKCHAQSTLIRIDSAYNFSIKFSPSMCVAVVAFLTEHTDSQHV